MKLLLMDSLAEILCLKTSAIILLQSGHLIMLRNMNITGVIVLISSNEYNQYI